MNGVVDSSHSISEQGDKVVIRRLELFAGFDPTIDDGKDEEIRKFDRRKVARIVDRTKQFISRKQHPRIVILHSQEDHSEPKEAVGAVLDIAMEERNGVPFIVGDVEMSKDDFAQYVASNRFPRRSAEIWSDDHMSEIALLGRDTPRRPLPDTRFTKTGEKFSFSCQTCFEAAPGAGNVFVPGVALTKKKDKTMQDEAKTGEKDEMAKLIAQKDAEIARLKEENRKMYNQTHVDIGSHKDEDEDDDEGDEGDEDEKKKSESKKSKNARDGARLEFTREKAKFEKRIAALEAQLAKERFSREIDAMASEGYAIDGCRDEMIEELASCPDPERKVKFWRENFRRDPVGIRVGAGITPRSGNKPEPKAIDKETVAKLVAEAAGDPEKFKTLMARAKSGA